MTIALQLLATPMPDVAARPPATTESGEPEVLARLIRRALARAGLSGGAGVPSERVLAAPFLPSLGLEASASPPTWRIYLTLSWPLDDVGGAVSGEAREDRRRVERRERLATRVARLWRARARFQTSDGEDPLEARLQRLRAAELEAELEALTGEPWAEVRP